MFKKLYVVSAFYILSS